MSNFRHSTAKLMNSENNFNAINIDASFYCLSFVVCAGQCQSATLVGYNFPSVQYIRSL